MIPLQNGASLHVRNGALSQHLKAKSKARRRIYQKTLRIAITNVSILSLQDTSGEGNVVKMSAERNLVKIGSSPKIQSRIE
jgi:hypothetical protein